MVPAIMLAGCLGFHAGPMPGEPAKDAYAALDVDGGKVRVHYVDVGEGPAVVLIHGFASSLVVWDDVIKVLAKNHRVIAMDLKGFGWTDRPEGDYSPPAQARIVKALLDARGVKTASVVGHSWGASVALAFALAEPTRVTKLALYSAWAFEDQLPTFVVWSRAALIGEALFRLFYTERPEDWIVRAYHDKRYINYQLVTAVSEAMHRPGARAAGLAVVRGQRYAALEQRYRSIEQPTLIMWGREDRVSLVGFGKRLAAELPNAELIVYPDTGHFPMIESKQQSTTALVAFLDEPDPVVAPAPAPAPPTAPAPPPTSTAPPATPEPTP